ncbi:hypothetical protein HZY83_00920 [Gemella sp. GH3]|nr:hypothetical protein [Gemella sp. GH3.1]NYS50223.1 hypothetical protein [Gemella sp. GH3]
MYGSIYLLSERLSSTRYFFIPGFYNENIFYEDYKKHFEKNYPKYIVIDLTKYSGLDILTDYYIKKVVENNYKLVKTVNNLSLYEKS